MAKSELACVYAALILADEDVPITEEKIKTILTAAGVEVKDLITNINPGIGPNISDVDQNTKSPEKDTQDEKNGANTQESAEESDDDPMDMFDLFGD